MSLQQNRIKGKDSDIGFTAGAEKQVKKSNEIELFRVIDIEVDS